MPFDLAWMALQDSLKTGTNIPNWSIAKGLLDGSFVVIHVRPGEIEVDPPEAEMFQKIKREDFEKVYKLWNGYIQGQVSRAAIRDETRFSTYIISIFHWLEGETGGVLP